MPPDLTVFAARHLATVDVVLAALVLVPLLYRRHHAAVVCWTITSLLALSLSFGFARIGSALYDDPRPFVVNHFTPLVPYAATNGFFDGYAVLAAAIVSAVLFLNRRWAIPFVVLALLIDWARMGLGVHHTIDLVFSWVFVALATLVAMVIGPIVTALLLPRIPSWWTAEPFRLARRAGDRILTSSEG
jgi:undecaprenyl-diphosphatase